MKKYFISVDAKRLGPFSLSELRNHGIDKSTLVWQEGYENWKCASEVDELKDIVFTSPPPLPHVNHENGRSERSHSQALEIKSIFRLIVYSAAIAIFSFFIFSIFIDEAFKYDYVKKSDIHLSGCCIQSRIPLTDIKPYGDIRRRCALSRDCWKAELMKDRELDEEFKRFKMILSRRKGDKIKESFHSSLVTFVITAISLILVRYLIKLVHWVKINSNGKQP